MPPEAAETSTHVLWINAGLGCDGDSVASTAATQPSIEEIALGALRGLKVAGAMGVSDHLGWEWKSKAGIPIVCVPGCPIHPDNLSETLTYPLYTATGPGAERGGAVPAVATSPGRARAR
ncbi:hypothetical protein AWC15_09505 [Mycobacterium lacus]|uniref:Uncharacterized protein n=1 Tax=Mycobacterium lacus TaxID=169765 RepID=A0A1X1XMN7_9MYCO|nr:hypothetical protein AWC15_09505 [Mycobacterium lacus]BBX97485.1 hypothetical protein MLAC_27790 [Mycobacterium lacus]